MQKFNDILIIELFNKKSYQELNIEEKGMLQLFFTIYVPKAPFPIVELLDYYQQNITNILKFFWFKKNSSIALLPLEESIIQQVIKAFKNTIK